MCGSAPCGHLGCCGRRPLRYGGCTRCVLPLISGDAVCATVSPASVPLKIYRFFLTTGKVLTDWVSSAIDPVLALQPCPGVCRPGAYAFGRPLCTSDCMLFCWGRRGDATVSIASKVLLGVELPPGSPVWPVSGFNRPLNLGEHAVVAGVQWLMVYICICDLLPPQGALRPTLLRADGVMPDPPSVCFVIRRPITTKSKGLQLHANGRVLLAVLVSMWSTSASTTLTFGTPTAGTCLRTTLREHQPSSTRCAILYGTAVS